MPQSENSLTDDHEVQIHSFLRFASVKREQHLSEVAAAIDDFKDLKVLDSEVYNSEDVRDMLRELKEEIQSTATKEFENAYLTGALAIRLSLEQADRLGVHLHVDTDQLENEFLIMQVAGSRSRFLGETAPAGFGRRPRILGRLPSPRTDALGSPAPGDFKDRRLLEQDLQDLKNKLERMQVQYTSAMRDRTEQRERVLELEEQLQQMEAEISAASRERWVNSSETQEKLVQLNHSNEEASERMKSMAAKLEDTEQELSATRQELEAVKESLKMKELEIKRAEDAVISKLSSTKQFLAIKSMMQQKSKEVVDLKRRLSQYEDRDVKNADEDEFNY